eukprot:7219854-Prymnesium_polylepis.1
MHAALTAEPHAPRNIIGGRSAHARDLGGTLHLSSQRRAADVAAPKTDAPAVAARVDGSSSQMDSCSPPWT